MAIRTHPIFFSFVGGEISPKLEGRIDLSQYQNGVKELRNFICLPQGGAKSRGGFHFVTETKELGQARLIPFTFAELQNYMNEFGNQYIRFFMNSGQIVSEWFESVYSQDEEPSKEWIIPYEISTPYKLEDDLWLIRFVQGDEYLYLVHPDYPPMVLTKVDHTAWTIAEIAFTWGNGSPWSVENGYPRTVCFHEGRLLFASTVGQPQTIWGSKTGESGPSIDMTPGDLDSDGYSFTASELNIIRWIYPGRELSIGALSGEATAIGPNDNPITPTQPPRIKSGGTSHGSSDLLAPLKIGKAIIFLQKAGRKLREFVFSYVDDTYNAPDLTIASDHLFESGLIDLVYQQEPDSIIWGITGDYDLLGCTYDRTQSPSIVGWHGHPTDGFFESIATIPYQHQDQLWSITNRLIDGVEKRYIEYYDPDICVDSGLTYSGDPITIIEGLEHLAKKAVEIVGDGAVYPPQIVPRSGKLTINPSASEIYVGLGYTPRLITNRPEVQTATGTSQGIKKRWNKVIARILDTTGIKINGQIIPARYGSDPMDLAPIPYSGDVNVENLGWDTDARITVEQPLPLKAHIVCITGSLVIGED